MKRIGIILCLGMFIIALSACSNKDSLQTNEVEIADTSEKTTNEQITDSTQKVETTDTSEKTTDEQITDSTQKNETADTPKKIPMNK